MQENLLQYIWQYQLFNANELQTINGEKLFIENQGTLNTDAGPDFTNARITIGETKWAGNIEIHVNTTDWQKHKHSSNDAYNNVILHVVFKHDSTYPDIPTLELGHRIPKHMLEKYQNLMFAKSSIPCSSILAYANASLWPFWKQRLLVERLENKIAPLEQTLGELKNNWEQLCFQTISRSFGLLKNADAFEQLAQHLPVKILFKHKNQQKQVDAILFGMAGFLQFSNIQDQYFEALKREWKFLKQKYELEELPLVLWKFSRMRPPAFPTNRLAQLSAFICRLPKSFNDFVGLNDVVKIKAILQATPNEYWFTHYRFGKQTTSKPVEVGDAFMDTIILNSIIPLRFLYNRNHNLKDNSIALLESLPLERNSIIKKWTALKIGMKSAYDSQAMLQLTKHYCFAQKCLQCTIGLSILKNEKA